MDELDFEYLNTFPDGDPARKALVFLKAGISTFAKKNYRDELTLKLIVAALTQAQLLVPVKVDFDELLGGSIPKSCLQIRNCIRKSEASRLGQRHALAMVQK